MRTGDSVVETGWMERLGWMLAAASISGFGAWLWASFRKVDRSAYERDLELIEKRFEHRFDEFEHRVVEPIRKRNSQFEQKFEALNEKLDDMRDTLTAIRTKLETAGNRAQ